MNKLSSMPTVGVAVVIAILALFALSLILLFTVFARYRHITARINGDEEPNGGFLRAVLREFADAYRQYGADTNTPAIISDAVNTRLSGMLLCERFLNNSVSLFVTLGLFGTFLGLSLSVGSLTELISYSNTSEWLSVLDSVGGGLMSALSGMGVAFYTSLVGVACSILLTILRSIFSPADARAHMETRLELWLDQSVAPGLATDAAKDDAELVHQMIGALDRASASMEQTMKETTVALRFTLDAFDKTVGAFNGGVHDFSEFNYSLSGTVERMDLAVRSLNDCLRELLRKAERSGQT